MIRGRFHRFIHGKTLSAALLALAVGLVVPSWAAVPEDDDEAPPNLEEIRARADAGNAKAQTQLGDLCMASSDYTNAVGWYRRAAGQSDVGAQLALATCLMTGRGTAKNPQEAARWLREAARLIEIAALTPLPAASPETSVPVLGTNAPALPPRSIVITRSGATNAPAPPAPAAAVAVTNLSRVQRVDALHAIEPVIQSAPPVPKPPPDSR